MDDDSDWRSLPTDSWVSRKRDNTNYRLTNKQLDYFREFAESSYSNWQMKNEIVPNAIDNFPTRFEDISEDISFIEQAGETTEKLWEEMLNIDQRAGCVNDVPFSSQKEPGNQEVQLGYEIGSIYELMMVNHASKDQRMNVARGFVLAFCGEAREGVDENRITAWEFADRLVEKHPPQATMTGEKIKELQETVGIEKPIGDTIPDALKQQGITPSAYLLELLEERAGKTNNQRSITNDKGDVEISFNIHSVSNDEAESVVADFLETYVGIKSFDNLHKPLLEDTKLVDRKEKYGTPADEIAEQLWKADERYSDSTLNGKITTNTGLTHTIHALHSLSAGYNVELWTNRPIVVELSDGWGLTDYGKVIAYLLFEVEKGITGSEVQDLIDVSKEYLKHIATLDFGMKLREVLHRTAISPATVDSTFVNLMKRVHENRNSCVGWRNRVSEMNNQD